jgi:ketosteroid isomerase-like protein
MRMIQPRLLVPLAVALLHAGALAAQQTVQLSPAAPPDRPVATRSDSAHAALMRLMEPYAQQARASYPQARERYLAGLPAGQSFFVTTRLRDAAGHVEQVFVAVDRIAEGRITGRIWNDVNLVRGFARGQAYTFPETELVDWLIAHPDGTEEGNFVGRFIDDYQRGRIPR